METKLFVGVAVSKDSLDVAIGAQQEIITFSNDQNWVDALVKKLRRMDPELPVFESTGGYELLATSSLVEAGLAAAIVNPRQVRKFAKATGILAKTDAIDAWVIARFAEAIKPEVRPLKDQATSELTALVTRRRQIVEMIVAESNRLKLASKGNKKDIKIISDGLKSASIKSKPISAKQSKLASSGAARTICYVAYRSLSPLHRPP